MKLNTPSPTNDHRGVSYGPNWIVCHVSVGVSNLFCSSPFQITVTEPSTTMYDMVASMRSLGKVRVHFDGLTPRRYFRHFLRRIYRRIPRGPTLVLRNVGTLRLNVVDRRPHRRPYDPRLVVTTSRIIHGLEAGASGNDMVSKINEIRSLLRNVGLIANSSSLYKGGGAIAKWRT